MLGGHKSAVNDVAVHPSGKLALSVSKDSTLRLWNLVQGRLAFTRRLKGIGHDIEFNENGSAYLITYENSIQIFATASNEQILEVKLTQRINRALFDSSHQDFTSVGKVFSIGEDKLLRVTSGSGQEVVYHYVEISAQDVQISSLNISALGGRPRNMWLCKDVIAIISSSGSLALINVESVLRGGTFDEALISRHDVVADPRFICVTGWYPEISSTLLFKLNAQLKFFKETVESSGQLSAAKKRKRKQIPAESDGGNREGKNSKSVRFASEDF